MTERQPAPTTLRGSEAYDAERASIPARRQQAHVPPDGPLCGLALSGGGIRAATVARGFVEALDRHGMFSHFDYLSTVSGGSYIGAAITEHIGRLGGSLPLPRNHYPLLAPRPTWHAIPYLVLEWVWFALPLFLLFLYPVVLAGPLSHMFPYSMLVPAALLLVALLPPLRRLVFRGDEDAKAFSFAGALLSFALVVAGTRFVWTLPVLFGTGCVLLHGYLGLHPHRTLAGSAGRIWMALLVLGLASAAVTLFALLGAVDRVWTWRLGVSCLAFLLFALWWTDAPARAWGVLVGLALATVGLGSVVPLGRTAEGWNLGISWISAVGLGFILWRTHLPVDRWNDFSLVMRWYQRNLAERFLPFSRWPQGRTLCSLRRGRHPLHVINTTVSAGDALRPFELSAMHCGSLADGYACTRRWLPRLTIEEAVAASGSAVDLHAVRFGWGTLVSMFTDGTARWIPPEPGMASPRPMLLARAFFLVKRPQRLALRLSDGGLTENLGVYALLCRRIERIVCLDNGFDPNFMFEDLQALCRRCAREGIAEIVLAEPASAVMALRLSAPGAGILEAEIRYPATDTEPARTGRLLIVKLHQPSLVNAWPRLEPHHTVDARLLARQYDGFPHFSTNDQNLTRVELHALYEVGRALADDLASRHADFVR